VSRIGPAHRRKGLPNQDAWLLRRMAWGELAVVADGLGSRAMSHQGARAACRAALQAAAAHCGTPAAVAAQPLLAALHAAWLANSWPHAARECSTTCVLALRSGSLLLLAQLGDGMAVACGRAGKASFLLHAGAPDFANVTDCLQERHVPAAWRVACLDAADFYGVVLCTDGIAADLVAGSELAFAADLLAESQGRSLREQRRDARRWLEDWPVAGHTDDKTIVCMMAPEGMGNAA
jgi:serine/threonine protein phosphatase PrpC